MKKFNDFVSEKNKMFSEIAFANQEEPVNDVKPMVNKGNLFADVGIDKKNINKTALGMRNILGTRGVAKTREDKLALRMVMVRLRTGILQLIRMGLTADDLNIVIQSIISLVINSGAASNTTYNQSKVNKSILNNSGNN